MAYKVRPDAVVECDSPEEVIALWSRLTGPPNEKQAIIRDAERIVEAFTSPARALHPVMDLDKVGEGEPDQPPPDPESE